MAKHHDNPDIEMIPDEESDGRDPGAKVKKLTEALEKSEAERKDYLAGWQRAKADLINYKKDDARRFEEFTKFANETIIAEAVQVLDSFDLALQHGMPKDVEKGIVLIRSQLEDILRRRGLEAMQSKGQKFNPSRHESVGEVEADGEEGMVIEEFQKGYLLHGKVLRPARVKISKKIEIRAITDNK